MLNIYKEKLGSGDAMAHQSMLQPKIHQSLQDLQTTIEQMVDMEPPLCLSNLASYFLPNQHVAMTFIKQNGVLESGGNFSRSADLYERFEKAQKDPEEIRRFSLNFWMDSQNHRFIIQAVLNRLSIDKNMLSDYLCQSTLFEPYSPAINYCCERYLAKDAIGFLYVAIPTIECALRDFLLGKGEVPKFVDGVDKKLMDLNDTLNHPFLIKHMDGDFLFYLRYLFTNSRDLNLKNCLATGILPLFEPVAMRRADLVLHALLVLSHL